MISRFFVSFFRAHRSHILRMLSIIVLSSFAFLLTSSITSLVQDTIQNETRAILGADIILESSREANDEDILILQSLTERYHIEIAKTIDFQSNLEIDERPYLTDIKIITENYPLVGEPISNTSGVLLSSSLTQLIGSREKLSLGDTDYDIVGEIPESGFGGFSLFSEGREVWIPETLADNSELLGLGARVRYSYYIVTRDDSLEALREYLSDDRVLPDWRIRDIESRQDVLASVFGEFQRFLQVFFIGIYVLAFFSLFFTLEALKRLIKRDIGLFVLLGYTKHKVLLMLLTLMLAILTLGYVIALAFASLAVSALQSFPLAQDLSLDISHITQSMLLTLCIIIFASLYTLRDFYDTSVLDLLKKPDLLAGKSFPRSILVYLLAGIAMLLFFLGASPISIVIQSLMILGVIVILASITKTYFYFLYTLIKTLRGKYFLLYHTLRACIRPGNMTLFISLPVMIVGSVFFFLLVFAISFLDITRIEEGQESYFILNISSQEREVLRERFGDIELYDILLARIVGINNTPLRDFLASSPRSGEFTREFNLTTNPLPDNTFTRGEELKSGTVSLDEDFASRLGVDIGDEVTFLLAGREVSYEVINTRPAQRGDFRPFFYVQLYPDDVEALDRSFFGVLESPELSTSELRSQIFAISPRLQLLDVSETLNEVTRILSQVYQGVLAIAVYVGVFVWILLSVSLTILSSLRKCESERLKLLGAPPSFTRNFLALEYLILLSFSLVLILFVGTLLSIWFFQSSSLFDFQLSYILKTSGILLLGALGLYISILVMQRRG